MAGPPSTQMSGQYFHVYQLPQEVMGRMGSLGLCQVWQPPRESTPMVSKWPALGRENGEKTVMEEAMKTMKDLSDKIAQSIPD